MKRLIIGCGYLGRRVAQRWLDAGDTVAALTRSADRAAQFHRFHDDGVLLLANGWDAGSARLIESLGAKALATTSAGVAWAQGYADGDRLPAQRLIDVAASIARAIRIPLSVDVEGGYSDDPAQVADTVAALIDIGAVGINLEDGGAGPERLCAKIERVKTAAARLGVALRAIRISCVGSDRRRRVKRPQPESTGRSHRRWQYRRTIVGVELTRDIPNRLRSSVSTRTPWYVDSRASRAPARCCSRVGSRPVPSTSSATAARPMDSIRAIRMFPRASSSEFTPPLIRRP